MARVLVVGADMRAERALLERLQRLSGLPEGRLSSCRGLDECDLLVVRDTPGLRHAALRMARQRPGMPFWIEAEDGGLVDGHAHERVMLEDRQIERVLCAINTRAPARGDAECVARGAKAVTRELRRRLRDRQGRTRLVLADGQDLLLDFGADLVAAPGTADARELPAHLGVGLDDARLEIPAPPAPEQVPRLPLRPLLWQAGQHGDHWRDLDAKLAGGAVVRLSRWPDFRVIARQPEGFRLCSLLLKRPASVRECASMLGLEVELVRQFVHSAYLCGYASLQPLDTPATPLAPAREGGATMLARMWRSLRQARH